MKIENIEKLFPSQALVSVLIGNKKDIKKDEMIRNLFKSEQREKLLPLFLHHVAKMSSKDKYIKFMTLFQKAFQIHGNTLSAATRATCQTAVALFGKSVEHEIARQNAVRGRLQRSNELGKAEFPLRELANKRKDGKALETLATTIKEATTIATSSAVARAVLGQKPIETPFQGASQVRLPGGENFILASCPTSIPETSGYFDMLLKNNVRTVISLHQEGEVNPESAFWTKPVLDKLKSRDGWTIECIQEKVCAEGTKCSFPPDMPKMKLSKQDKKLWYPRIVERTLRARKGNQERILTHLHYENWHDHTACPDFGLLETLIARKNALAAPQEACAINCRAGVGRAGFVASAIVCTNSLRAQMAHGKKADELTCNIALPFFYLRCARQSMSVKGEKLSLLANFLSRYNDRRKLETLSGLRSKL
jgi:protein tyrosine phosphatase